MLGEHRTLTQLKHFAFGQRPSRFVRERNARDQQDNPRALPDRSTAAAIGKSIAWLALPLQDGGPTCPVPSHSIGEFAYGGLGVGKRDRSARDMAFGQR